MWDKNKPEFYLHPSQTALDKSLLLSENIFIGSQPSQVLKRPVYTNNIYTGDIFGMMAECQYSSRVAYGSKYTFVEPSE